MRRLLAVSCVLLAGCTRDSSVAVVTAPRCTDCDIVLERVATISDAVEPGALPDRLVYVERDASGRLYTISRARDAVLVFDSTGTFLRRLGRPGEGPGEFRNIRRVFIGAADSIHVSDWGINRITVFAPDFTMVRMLLMPSLPSLVLADGRYVLADRHYTPELTAKPVHVVGADGVLQHSFGADTPADYRLAALTSIRLVAASPDGSVWSVAPGRYLLERWDPSTGMRTDSLPIRSSWFREVDQWPGDERVRPPATVATIWEDDGLLWLLFRDADADWQAPPRANIERPIDADEYDRTFDWVIEVVDPMSRGVIASRRFDRAFWGRMPSKLLVSAHADSADEVARYDVWKAVLKERSKQGGER